MANKFTVTTKYKSNNLPKLLEAAKRLGDLQVSVGVHNDAGSYPATEDNPNPPLVSTVAIAQEYGSEHNPPRPFFYPTLAKKEPQIKAKLARAIALVSERFADPVKALSTVGFAVQVWVQNTIKSNVGPKLGWNPGSKRYLAKRLTLYPESGSRTLIASGLLLRAVRFKVWEGKEVVFDGPASGDAPASPISSKGAQAHGASADVPGALEGRAAARASAEGFRKARDAGRAAAKADPAGFKVRFLAQRGAHGLPPKKGH